VERRIETAMVALGLRHMAKLERGGIVARLGLGEGSKGRGLAIQGQAA